MAAIGLMAQLVASLLEGGTLDAIIAKKLDVLGEDFLNSQLNSPLEGAVNRLGSAFDTGGQSEFDRLRNTWLNKLKGGSIPHAGLINKLLHVLDTGSQSRRGNAKWARSGWANSRNDWLDSHWRHDWRSQPRDLATGRWMPGRLDHIADSLRYRGVHAGRATKRRRKLRRQSRARGRKAARQLFRKRT